jgi:hypothetical protein
VTSPPGTTISAVLVDGKGDQFWLTLSATLGWQVTINGKIDLNTGGVVAIWVDSQGRLVQQNTQGGQWYYDKTQAWPWVQLVAPTPAPAPTSGPGPAATSAFITADFGAPTGRAILPQLWGVSMAGTAWTSCYGSASWRSAVAGLNFRFVRQHLEGLFGSIFSSYTATPNWSPLAPFVQYFKAVFPNAMLQLGAGWPPSWCTASGSASQADISGWVSMWGQLVDYLVAHGITPDIVDGPFNEPNYTNVSAQFASAIGGAVFTALHGKYPAMKFSGPCTAGFDQGYNTPLVTAYPGLSYLTFHNYNGYNAGAYQLSSLIGDPTFLFWGAQPPAATRPGLMNEWRAGMDSSVNSGIPDAIYSALCLITCGTKVNIPIAGIWQVAPDGTYPGVMSDGTISPALRLLSRAGQSVSGTAVACNNPSNVQTLACKRGTVGLGVLLTNYGSAAASGPIALSHWPVNSTGSGVINMWQQSGSNSAGAITQVTVTAGLTSSITLPANSNTILYA